MLAIADQPTPHSDLSASQPVHHNTLTQAGGCGDWAEELFRARPDQGHAQTDASSLSQPEAAFPLATEVYIADSGNSRTDRDALPQGRSGNGF